MRKNRGPALCKSRIELVQCPTCSGKTFVQGVFHQLACVHCHASGWVAAETGEALPLEELVTQLSLRLQAAQRHINELKHPRATGPEAIYQEGNRRGAGGSNRTLD
ncbi:MAG: hypothetical protein RSG92_17575 [Pseudomonas sp.]